MNLPLPDLCHNCRYYERLSRRNPAKLYHVCQTIEQFVDNSKIIVKVHTQHEKNIIAELGISNIIIENDVMSQQVSRLIID